MGKSPMRCGITASTEKTTPTTLICSCKPRLTSGDMWSKIAGRRCCLPCKEDNMQLILKTDLEKQIPAKIEWNNDELKTELSEKLKDYKNLVVTEDTIQSAKGDRAELN